MAQLSSTLKIPKIKPYTTVETKTPERNGKQESYINTKP